MHWNSIKLYEITLPTFSPSSFSSMMMVLFSSFTCLCPVTYSGYYTRYMRNMFSKQLFFDCGLNQAIIFHLNNGLAYVWYAAASDVVSFRVIALKINWNFIFKYRRHILFSTSEKCLKRKCIMSIQQFERKVRQKMQNKFERGFTANRRACLVSLLACVNRL